MKKVVDKTAERTLLRALLQLNEMRLNNNDAKVVSKMSGLKETFAELQGRLTRQPQLI